MDPVNKFGLPFLLFGSLGAGVKIYIRDGLLLDAEFLDELLKKNASTQTTPSNSITVVTPKEDNSYGAALQKLNLTLVSGTTTDAVMKNILIQRMYPHYFNNISYQKDRLFQGSQSLILKGKKYTTSDKKTLFVLDQPTTEDINKLRQDCIRELPKEKTDNKQLLKLKEWCTEPTVKAVLERHKLNLLDTNTTKDDSKWKEIIAGGWFIDKYKSQQTFITGSDLDKFKNISDQGSVTKDQIDALKAKCRSIEQRAYVKNYFPATKDFIDKLSDSTSKARFSGIDIFQQAVLFCVDPVTTSTYVEKAMDGKPETVIDSKRHKDYCYDSTKNIEYYKNLKTYEPFDGKSFWCAVRLVYKSKYSGKK